VPSGPQRQVFRFPRLGTGFRGELDVEGMTDEAFATGYLAEFRNYHLIGRGRARKRRGWQHLSTTKVSGSSAIQGLGTFNSGTTTKLVAACYGTIKNYNGTDWTDITGTLTIGAGDQINFAQFGQEGTFYLIGTAGGNYDLWKWDGTASPAVSLYQATDAKPAPRWAKDIAEWRGRLWAINTPLDDSAIQFSDNYVIDSWDEGNYIYPSRFAAGIGLASHNNGVLLAFYEDSVHRIEFDTNLNDYSSYVVDGNTGCSSSYSIVTAEGITYFAGERGLYRIRSANRPAEYISWPIQDYWNSLNQARTPYIWGFDRQEPWTEVVWLVSTGTNTQHNAAIVYNTELESWSIFESETGSLKFNCGCDYRNTEGKHFTVLGGYDGIVSEAWGDDNHDTNSRDGGDAGAVITTNLGTGMLDFGYPGLKRLREIWLDMQVNSDRIFSASIETVGGTVVGVSPTPAVSVGAAGNRFDVAVFDSATFGSDDTPEQARILKSIKARMFRFNITESGSGSPHTINSMTFHWIPRDLRFKAIV